MKGNVDRIVENVPLDVVTVFGLKILRNKTFPQVQVVNKGGFFEQSEKLLRLFGYNEDAEWLIKHKPLLEDLFVYNIDMPVELLSQYVNDLIFLHIRNSNPENGTLDDVSLRTVFPFWKIDGKHVLEQIFYTAFNNNRVSETIFSETLHPTLGFRNSGMLTFPETVLQNYHHMLMISLKIVKNDIHMPHENLTRVKHVKRLEEYCSEKITIFDCDDTMLKNGEYPFMKTPRMLSTLYYSDIPIHQWNEVVGLPHEWVQTLSK